MRKLALLVSLFLLCVAAGLSVDSSFYAGLLERGKGSFSAGRYEQAAKELRIAAFGLLDSLSNYQTAHIYLALAHQQLGNSEQAAVSARKVAEAEKIAPVYASLKLDEATRRSFEQLAANILTREEFASLTSGARRPEQTVTRPAPPPPPVEQPAEKTRAEIEAERRAVQELERKRLEAERAAAVQREAEQTEIELRREAERREAERREAERREAERREAERREAERRETERREMERREAARREATPPVEPRPDRLQPSLQRTPIVIQASVDRAALPADVRRTLEAADEALRRNELQRARDLYFSIVHSASAPRDAVLEAARGLYQASDFRGSVMAFSRLGSLEPGEEQFHYYAAVALFEIGSFRAAKKQLRCALPFIDISDDVARYRMKIQGAIE